MNKIFRKINFFFEILSKFYISKQINIVTLSSYTTQLAFLVANKYHCEYFNNKETFNIFYILFIFPCSADKKLNNILKNVYEENSKNYFLKIKINSISKRLLVSPFLIILFLIQNFKKIYLWQPRYRWINDSLTFKSPFLNTNKFASRCLKKISIKLPVPGFKKILFGDGFLNLMPYDTPEWLIKRNEGNVRLIKKNDLYASYHLFDVQNKELNLNSKKINSKFVRNILIDHIRNKYDQDLLNTLEYIFNIFKKKNISRKALFIFPTTTFAETKRSGINEEIEMYISYLKNSNLNSFNYLLIKPHPGSQITKNKYLYEKLKKINQFNHLHIFNPYPNYSNFCLGNIPLEIICAYIIEHIRATTLSVACCSTATLSTKNIFPEINIKKAFGSSLIKKYIKKDFINQRIKQEFIIEKNLFHLKN